jgi:hypothetical protein
MVDIHSIAASSNPSRREREAEGEATSHLRVGRTRRTSGHTAIMAMPATTAATQRQHSAIMMVMPPPAASPEVMLVAVHTLLNNPPGLDASPEAAKQWRIDVDQLVITAINNPSRRRHPIQCSGWSTSAVACAVAHAYNSGGSRPDGSPGCHTPF